MLPMVEKSMQPICKDLPWIVDSGDAERLSSEGNQWLLLTVDWMHRHSCDGVVFKGSPQRIYERRAILLK